MVQYVCSFILRLFCSYMQDKYVCVNNNISDTRSEILCTFLTVFCLLLHRLICVLGPCGVCKFHFALYSLYCSTGFSRFYLCLLGSPSFYCYSGVLQVLPLLTEFHRFPLFRTLGSACVCWVFHCVYWVLQVLSVPAGFPRFPLLFWILQDLPVSAG